jgi:hypothetical protein
MTSEQLAVDVLRAKTESEPPSPWRCIRVTHPFEGVTAVGFAPGTELLIVLTHSGISVVDGTTGDTLAEQGDADDDDPYPVSVNGIGPLQGQRIAVAGLWGGGLRWFSPDGWSLSAIAPRWPTQSVALMPPDSGEPIESPELATVLVDGAFSNIRAFGFSDTGRTLVVATTGLSLWGRP